MPKYMISRRSIINELYEVVADTEEEALAIAYDGDIPEPYATEFCDWYDEQYEVDSIEDELVTFINSKEQELA